MSMKDSWPTGVMQPVAFSLAAVLEVDKKGKTTNQAMTVDADNIEELTRLINFVEPELGFRFFSSRNERREPLNAVEAHWRGIKVHQGTGETSCSFCTDFERSSMYKFLRQYEDSEAYLLGHCSEIYQPLKKFMLQHLKHVRYVRPARGWNDGDVRGSSSKRQFQDLIAGFTPAGVLCGVYVRARDAKSE
ncbi:hypothetical protein PHYBOEH_005883 [Phytophthora boehmeriae]|uniref:Uncharacterized protein n=1 Tax=Phytophthora boehmeriae TaxID=109152 RepID=A0A8T1WJE9_9STRA|nr:hypothetical protein PHYBOEH_005883 [Phytophthora boehmeriae]